MEPPYLLFLGDAADDAVAKTATGVAHWRPDSCVGEFALDGCGATTGLPRMTPTEAVAAGAKTLVVGVANAGGVIHPSWTRALHDALRAGLDLASGLHTHLASIPELRDEASRLGRTLHEVRVPPSDLDVGRGAPRPGRRLLTVGTDCSVGKMFTALAIERELRERGVRADFRATGQTGIFIAGEGIPIDAVVADFISGAAERLAPANDPDHWDVIEGQGSLFHPAYAGVSLGLLHGSQAEALVMCHEPTRTEMRGAPGRGLPSVPECIEANERAARLTEPRARVVAVAINTRALPASEAETCIATLARTTGLPCVDPLRHGVGPIVDGLLTR
ncbi:MAG: DUF1611 domain-containing protein [Planctomycetes bacterium]|nr:DUF1611 domain-containing protein [Planctomycetota bacterium]